MPLTLFSLRSNVHTVLSSDTASFFEDEDQMLIFEEGEKEEEHTNEAFAEAYLQFYEALDTRPRLPDFLENKFAKFACSY
jgi:hypothetical protein